MNVASYPMNQGYKESQIEPTKMSSDESSPRKFKLSKAELNTKWGLLGAAPRSEPVPVRDSSDDEESQHPPSLSSQAPRRLTRPRYRAGAWQGKDDYVTAIKVEDVTWSHKDKFKLVLVCTPIFCFYVWVFPSLFWFGLPHMYLEDSLHYWDQPYWKVLGFVGVLTLMVLAVSSFALMCLFMCHVYSSMGRRRVFLE